MQHVIFILSRICNIRVRKILTVLPHELRLIFSPGLGALYSSDYRQDYAGLGEKRCE